MSNRWKTWLHAHTGCTHALGRRDDGVERDFQSGYGPEVPTGHQAGVLRPGQIVDRVTYNKIVQASIDDVFKIKDHQVPTWNWDWALYDMYMDDLVKALPQTLFKLSEDKPMDPPRRELLKVYCIPRGGLILGALIDERHPGRLEFVSDPNIADVILDDVVDTGKTIESMTKPVYCLVKKPWARTKPAYAAVATMSWVTFPYEFNADKSGYTFKDGQWIKT